MAIVQTRTVAVECLERSIISSAMLSFPLPDARVSKSRDATMVLELPAPLVQAGIKRKAPAEDAQTQGDRQTMLKRARVAEPVGVDASYTENTLPHVIAKDTPVSLQSERSSDRLEGSVDDAPHRIAAPLAPEPIDASTNRSQPDAHPWQRQYQPSLLSGLPRFDIVDHQRNAQPSIWKVACKTRVQAIMDLHSQSAICSAEATQSPSPHLCTHERERLRGHIEAKIIANAIFEEDDRFCNYTPSATASSDSSDSEDSDDDEDSGDEDIDVDEDLLLQLQNELEKDLEDEGCEPLASKEFVEVDDLDIFGALPAHSEAHMDAVLPAHAAVDEEDVQEDLDGPRMEESVEEHADDNVEDDSLMLPVTIPASSSSHPQLPTGLPRLSSVRLYGWREDSLLGRGTPRRVREDPSCRGTLADLEKRCHLSPFSCYRCKMAHLLRKQRFMSRLG